MLMNSQNYWCLRIDNVTPWHHSVNQPSANQSCALMYHLLGNPSLAFKRVYNFEFGEFGIYFGHKPPISFHGPAITLSLLQTDVSVCLASLCVWHTNLGSVTRLDIGRLFCEGQVWLRDEERKKPHERPVKELSSERSFPIQGMAEVS